MEKDVRWNIKVSEDTDLMLRSCLSSHGMKKGDLSRFIEDAVRWRIFNRTTQDIKANNAGADPDHLESIVDQGWPRFGISARDPITANARRARRQYSDLRADCSVW
jgi:hypothetical protein